MASIQSAPNMAAGNMSLPPNLTQQHIQEVYQVSFVAPSLSPPTGGPAVPSPPPWSRPSSVRFAAILHGLR